MNPPATAGLKRTLSEPIRRTSSFYERAVLDALQQMTRGCLQLELPDGFRCVLGQTDATERASVRIVRPNFFKRCVLYGDVGFGEAYVEGDWETPDITAVIAWFILNVENSPGMSGSRSRRIALNLLGWYNRIQHLLRPNSLDTSKRNIAEHYDLGTDFYRLFLDPTMTYSAADFAALGNTLEQAQIAKYDRLCRQLRLRPGEHVLEIGSGWGGFSRHAATQYGCEVTTITISQAQFEYAQQLFQREGLADRVHPKLMDYRLLTGRYDKIVSIEMLEAVGDAYLETYFGKCQQLLKPEGLLALQMITCPDARYNAMRRGVDWIQKHIFPGSLLLSINRVNQAISRTGDLMLHDLHDLGLDYAETLRRWRQEFNRNGAEVAALGFDERFRRKWNYYLSYCEAAFARRNISVVQAIYTRANNPTLMSLGGNS